MREEKDMQIGLYDIDKYYHRGKDNEVHALRNVGLQIEQGELVAVIGASGSGKSTLLKIIGLLDTYEQGTYVLGDQAVEKLNEREKAKLRNQKIGFIMQDFALLEDRSALANVMTPLLFDRQYTLGQAKQKAMEAMRMMRMEEYVRRKVSQLSGGQKQRIAICRAIANDPQLILADEPTGALDRRTADEVMSSLVRLNAQGHTILIVTHDPRIAQRCHTVYVMEDGCISRKEPE